MRMKAKNELDEWEGRIRRQQDEVGEHQAPRLTMSVVMQRRTSFSNRKAVNVNGISAEVPKSIAWRVLLKINKAFEMRYEGQYKEDIDTWLRSIIVLIPRKR